MTEATKKAVQFGAGNIGRGFIGQILSQAGYEVVFVDVVESLINLINQRQKYTIKETKGTEQTTTTIENVTAINGMATDEVADAIRPRS